MPLHHPRDGYTFRADAHTLRIEPGQKPITLERWELERLGLAIRDDYQVPLADEEQDGQMFAGILTERRSDQPLLGTGTKGETPDTAKGSPTGHRASPRP